MSRAGQSGAAAGGFGGSSSFIDKVVEGIAESETSLDSNQQFLNLVAQARSNPVAQKAIQEIYLGLEASPAKQAEVEAIAGEYLKPAEAVEAARRDLPQSQKEARPGDSQSVRVTGVLRSPPLAGRSGQTLCDFGRT